VRELPQPLFLERCGEVSIDDCQLVHSEAGPKDALLIVVEARRLHVQNSALEQHLRASRERMRNLLAHEPRLLAVFEGDSRGELTVRATRLSGTLAGDLHDREHMAENLELSIDRLGRDLGPREVAAARELAIALRTDGIAPATLAGRMGGIFAAAAVASPGTALVLAGTDGDLSICHNQIVGAVSLQGLPAAGDWTEDELRRIGALLPGPVSFGESEGTLRLEGNELTRLAVDNAMLKQLKDLIPAGGGKIVGTIRTTLLCGNIFLDGGNQLVSPHVSLDDNSFDRVQKIAGAVISQMATFTSNRSFPENLTLYNVSAASAKAANLLDVRDL
jgi:hypothetical protein